MSYTERNKGVLTPTGVDTENFTDDDFDMYRDNGYFVIDGEIYSAKIEINRASDEYHFAEVKVDGKGRIHYHTMHYNGGASLEEVIEDAL